jgi:hypothetical protein
MPAPKPARATHLRTLDASAPLATRLLDALRYPLRGAGLAALVALSLGHMLAGWIPGIVSWVANVVVWISAYMYALECLRRTANGYAWPPEVTLYDNSASGAVLFALQLAGLAAIVLAQYLAAGVGVVAVLLALLLPAMTMALAFGDSAISALHPRHLVRTINGFGIAYLLPVALGIVQYLVWIDAMRHAAGVLRTSLWYALIDYVLLLDFLLMGRLMHRHHEGIGHHPEADDLVLADTADAAAACVADARALAGSGHADAAIELLGERLQQVDATAAMHAQYRQLLRARGDRGELLAHARPYIATLLLDDAPRRALGVVQECIDLDPDFLPGDADTVGELADAAARLGMSRLALKLARAYPNHWPREPAAPRYGLLAARILAERMHQPAEAGVLAAKLLRAYPHSEERAGLDALLQSLGMAASTEPAP